MTKKQQKIQKIESFFKSSIFLLIFIFLFLFSTSLVSAIEWDYFIYDDESVCMRPGDYTYLLDLYYFYDFSVDPIRSTGNPICNANYKIRVDHRGFGEWYLSDYVYMSKDYWFYSIPANESYFSFSVLDGLVVIETGPHEYHPDSGYETRLRMYHLDSGDWCSSYTQSLVYEMSPMEVLDSCTEYNHAPYYLKSEIPNVTLSADDGTFYSASTYFEGFYDYEGYEGFVNYTDPVNGDNLSIVESGGSLNLEKFELNLYDFDALLFNSYDENYTTPFPIKWGYCNEFGSDCVWDEFYLQVISYASSPPVEDTPFSCLYIDNCYYDGGDVYLYGDVDDFNLNDYYSSYNIANFSIKDTHTNVTYYVNNSRFSNPIYNDDSDVNVTLDPSLVAGDIQVFLNATGSNLTYFNFSVYNGGVHLYDDFYYFPILGSGVTLNTIEDLYLINNDYEEINLINYSNLSYANFTIYYDFAYYDQVSTPEGCAMAPCTPNFTLNDDYFRVGLTNDNVFFVNSFEQVLNLTIELIVYDDYGAYDNQNFSIYFTGDNHTISWGSLADVFPDIGDEQVSHLTAFIIIMALFVICILFICIPLRFNKASIFMTIVITLFVTFVMAYVGYGQWSWFIVPSVILLLYFVIKLVGGND